MYGLGIDQNLPLNELIDQLENTLGTPEAPAKEQAQALAKYMVEEIAIKFGKSESNDMNKREQKQ